MAETPGVSVVNKVDEPLFSEISREPLVIFYQVTYQYTLLWFFKCSPLFYDFLKAFVYILTNRDWQQYRFLFVCICTGIIILCFLTKLITNSFGNYQTILSLLRRTWCCCQFAHAFWQLKTVCNKKKKVKDLIFDNQLANNQTSCHSACFYQYARPFSYLKSVWNVLYAGCLFVKSCTFANQLRKITVLLFTQTWMQLSICTCF